MLVWCCAKRRQKQWLTSSALISWSNPVKGGSASTHCLKTQKISNCLTFDDENAFQHFRGAFVVFFRSLYLCLLEFGGLGLGGGWEVAYGQPGHQWSDQENVISGSDENENDNGLNLTRLIWFFGPTLNTIIQPVLTQWFSKPHRKIQAVSISGGSIPQNQ